MIFCAKERKNILRLSVPSGLRTKSIAPASKASNTRKFSEETKIIGTGFSGKYCFKKSMPLIPGISTSKVIRYKISDTAWGEFQRPLEHKAVPYGKPVIVMSVSSRPHGFSSPAALSGQLQRISLSKNGVALRVVPPKNVNAAKDYPI